MQSIVLSTCGTSILTHSADAALRKELNLNANTKTPQEWQGDYASIHSFIERARKEFLELQPAEAAKRSAELNALFAWYDSGHLGLSKDMHYLVHSDTLLGKETAACVAEYLKARFGAYAQFVTANNLNTSNGSNFHEALKELTRRLRDYFFSYGTRPAAKIIFNLTGGFKGLNAYLQVVANLWADQTIILFETGKLLTIPRLPLSLDTSTIESNIVAARRLSQGLRVLPSEIGSLPEIFYTHLGGECVSSDIGDLVIAEALPKIYRTGLQPSPSPRLIYGPKFARSIEHLEKQKDRLVMLQQQIDAAARHIETLVNPSSLNFKDIGGKDGFSHEFYAWSDNGADRVYLNKQENGTYVIQELGPHTK
jgi:putative CRISPR-associated protein (TIGR02619 family)